MSTQEHFYFQSQHGPPEFAAEIAPAVGMTVFQGVDGATYLSRPLPDGGQVGGELHTNDLIDGDDPSFLDVFPLVLDLGITVPGRGRQMFEARALFTELAEVSPVPVALVRGYDFLIGIAGLATGLLWFPEGITPYADHREVWLPFQPAPPGSPPARAT
ncbi:hypothetical protein [Actinoplanes derwentensis]|uniref:Uncharacterized protein n=1 Tax=Actinoplanes derwentensis TaxID=113562 RepID=A0A1H2CGF2_9ACTN|nr:hypothetical protein [Actinoplanes derwentensis]SDT69533.1 hypothetical protein SAMN04489716_5786 [Actinoplanes derwentensis]